MAYIGNSPANIGNYQIVDDIASGFNGSLVSFALASGGIAITPAKSGQILANINGVMQEPDDGGTNGFKVTGSNIVFSSAPANGDTFWAVYQGQNVDIGTPSDDVVDTAHIKDDAVTAAKLANSINTAIAANTAKTGITTSQASAITANTAKTGITSSQSSAITANTAKTGITSSQATAITAALPKAGGAMTGNVTHADNVKAQFGTGTDFEIYSGGEGVKLHANNGVLEIEGDSVQIWNKAAQEAMAKFTADSSVELYHNAVKKFETASDGVLATGEITSNGGGFRVKTGSTTLGGIFKSGTIEGNSNADVTVFAETGKKIHLCANGSATKVLSVSANGLLFNGDTAAANALDDYEEGTCTIQYKAAGSGTLVGGSNNCNYTKVGRLVTVSGDISGDISGLTQNAIMELMGLPFITNGNGTFPFFTRNFEATGSNTINTLGYHGNNSTHLQIWTMPNHGNYVQAKVQDFHGSTNDCYFTVTYQTD